MKLLRPELFEHQPQAVLFDTDNTLYNADIAHAAGMSASEQKACKLLGVSADTFREAFTSARALVKKQLGATASSHSRLLYFQNAIEILGLKTQLLMTLDLEQTYWRTFLNKSVLYPGVREFVQDLRGIGIRTAVITDLTAHIQFRKLIYFGLDGLFDFVVTSEEAGSDKPARAPFEIALRKLEVAPDKCWMIGDNSSADMGGARAFGITALFKRHGVRDSDDQADLAFDDFIDVRNFLAKRGWVDRDADISNA